jgi:molecular chaperone Hsp33
VDQQDTDTVERFIIGDSAVRGQIVVLSSSLETVLAKHDYPLEIQGLLGELLAAAVMLVSTVKIEGSIILQAQGGSPVHLLMVECDHEHRVRALARWEGDVTSQGFAELLSGSALAITIDPRGGERYQGIVPLEGDSLSQALEFYFSQSEQLPTRFWLVQGSGRAAGFMLQQIPFNSSEQRSREQTDEDWNRIVCLADTLTADEQLHLPPHTLLHRLFHEEDVRLLGREPVDFRCTCSRERFAQGLAGLGREELDGIIAEQGKVTTCCQFCNQTYFFDAVDIDLLFSPRASKAPERPQ